MCFQSSAARKNRSNACAKHKRVLMTLDEDGLERVNTSARLPISITCSAFSASMTAPGPTESRRRAARGKADDVVGHLTGWGREMIDGHRTTVVIPGARSANPESRDCSARFRVRRCATPRNDGRC